MDCCVTVVWEGKIEVVVVVMGDSSPSMKNKLNERLSTSADNESRMGVVEGETAAATVADMTINKLSPLLPLAAVVAVWDVFVDQASRVDCMRRLALVGTLDIRVMT